MKHILFIVVIAFSINVNLNANSYRWGKVSTDELKITQTVLDTSAVAVVLFDVGSLKFNYGSKIYFERHKRIKILKKEGLSYADVQIPYYKKSDLEIINVIKAETINYDETTGKTVIQKLDKNDFFTIDINDRWSAKRFTFPDVKVGSIIEYSYLEASQNYLSLQDWAFQCELPTIHSSFSASVEKDLDVQILYYGVLLRHKYGVKPSDHWELDNMPPVAAEPYGPNENDYIENIAFQLKGYYKTNGMGAPEYVTVLDTWDHLASDYRASEYIPSYTNPKGFVEPLLNKIIRKEDSDVEKARKIFYYVESHFHCRQPYGLYPTQNSKQLVENGLGNGPDINLFLIQLLRSEGIAADPVLISTKDNGEPTDVYPKLGQFNKVIVAVMLYGKTYLLDATGGDYPFGLIPSEDLNKKGFRIGNSTSDWVSLLTDGASKLDCYYSVDLTNLKNAKLAASYSFTQYAAVGLRSALKSSPDQEAYVKEHIALLSHLFALDSISVRNLDDMNQPLNIRCYFSGGDYSGNDYLILRNLGISSFDKNPFVSKTRMLPVDFGYPIDETYTTVFTLPEGYLVDGLPLNEAIQLPDKKGSARLISNSIGNMVTIRRTMTLTGSFFYPSDYEPLKRFFDLVSQLKNATVMAKTK